jgi:hypothetical protein
MPSQTILKQCDPRLITVDDSCGCSLTRASISAMKPSDFEDLFWKEVGMSRIVANWKEARMTGVLQRALTDLFMSRMTPIKRINLGQSPQQSVIAPYILVPQQHRVNANYFVIESGEANANAGIGATPASAWDLTIINESSDFASPLVDLEKYFLPGRYLTALYKNALTGTGHTVQFKILSATNADIGGVSKAVLTVQPNVTDATWATYGTVAQAVYQPEGGLVIPLSNSISNYESWCYQDPSENTWKLKAFWLQTARRTHCYNDEYIAAITAPLTDDLFKKFRLLPLAQQKKRQMALAERAWWNTIFFGQEIDENQTVETYEDLPHVYDPTNPNCLLEYKANTLGIRTQLAECSRVTDYQGGALDLDVIKELLYTLKRTREAGGGSVTRIDAMTDRHTAANIMTLMIKYYKDKYSFDTTRFYTPNQKLEFAGQILWNYAIYEFPDEGVELAVIHDPFFDDHLAAFPAAHKSMGRYFWLIDWSDVAIGMAGSKSVTRQTNIADNVYNCIIDPVVQHYQLYSETFAVMVQDPNRHAIFHNFSDECPNITVDACTPGS